MISGCRRWVLLAAAVLFRGRRSTAAKSYRSDPWR